MGTRWVPVGIFAAYPRLKDLAPNTFILLLGIVQSTISRSNNIISPSFLAISVFPWPLAGKHENQVVLGFPAKLSYKFVQFIPAVAHGEVPASIARHL